MSDISTIATKLRKFYWKHDWDGFSIEDMFDEIKKFADDLAHYDGNGKFTTSADIDEIEKSFSVFNALKDHIENAEALYTEIKDHYM